MSAPKRIGDFIVTFSGLRCYPLDPRPEEICLEDIATALSNECRFGGHLAVAYNVAQHSVLVAMHSSARVRRQSLMHDATEAYLKDIPRPIKKYLRDYGGYEARMARCIGGVFGIVQLEALPVAVHEQDARALATEKRDLFTPSRLSEETVAPWLGRITPWTSEEAKKAFLGMAHELGIKEIG